MGTWCFGCLDRLLHAVSATIHIPTCIPPLPPLHHIRSQPDPFIPFILTARNYPLTPTPTQDNTPLATTTSPIFLLETSLRPRYYLPPTSVNWSVLSKSDTETFCPYKGRANYYNITVNGKEYKDLVWYYQYPIPESAAIAGHLCFYNEKVDVWVDGVKEER